MINSSWNIKFDRNSILKFNLMLLSIRKKKKNEYVKQVNFNFRDLGEMLKNRRLFALEF